MELANAVYLSNWYKGDITTVKDITFVIARMQKPITITMGKFAPNDLQVYIGVRILFTANNTLMKTMFLFIDYENLLLVLHFVVDKEIRKSILSKRIMAILLNKNQAHENPYKNNTF